MLFLKQIRKVLNYCFRIFWVIIERIKNILNFFYIIYKYIIIPFKISKKTLSHIFSFGEC